MKTWKKVLIGFIVLGIVSGSAVFYYVKVICARPIDMASKSAILVTADDLFASFKTNKAHWDSTYIDKAIELSGKVKETKTDSITSVTIVGSDSTASFSCLFQKVDPSVKVGDNVSVKGMCRGSEDDILSGGTIFRINEAVMVKH